MQRIEINTIKLVKSDTFALQLRQNPALVNQKDSEGLTLLHRTLLIASTSKEPIPHLMGVFRAIINTPGVDYNLQDNTGNTALQLAVKYSANEWIANNLLPQLLTKAASSKTNFKQENNSGRTLLHVACEATSGGYVVDLILNMVDKSEVLSVVNSLPSHGRSPLYVACVKGNFAAAKSLLAAGADPLLCGKEEFSPVKFIKETLKAHTETLALLKREHKDKPNKEMLALKNKIDALEGLRKTIYEQPRIQNLKEAHKNARMLGEITRQNQFFANTPRDVRSMIAANSNDSTLLPTQEHEKILNKDIYNQRNFVKNKVAKLIKDIPHLEKLLSDKTIQSKKEKKALVEDLLQILTDLKTNQIIDWNNVTARTDKLRAQMKDNANLAKSDFAKLFSDISAEIKSIERYEKQIQTDNNPPARNKRAPNST